MHQLSVATANTHEAEMLHEKGGMRSFLEAKVDVLLMQEVLGVDGSVLDARLNEDGYSLAHFDGPTGLAIAVSKESIFQPDSHSVRTEIIMPAEKVGDFARKHGIAIGQRLRPRGLISVKLTDGEDSVTVASTHPIVFVRALARAKQIKQIATVLNSPYYQNNPLVLGGDMNHYPGPRKVDIAMQKAAGLSAVETGPTWKIRGSKHERYARAAAFLTRWQMDRFDGELDVILFKGLIHKGIVVVDIASDHDAIIANFDLST